MDEELMNTELDEEDIIDNETPMEDIEYNIDIEETVEIIDVEEAEEVEIEVDEAIGWVGGDNTRHYSLYGRDEADQHPITAITGLREELNDIEALDVVYSNERNQANYYLWEDENILQENRVGYFVSICDDINEIKLCNSDNDIFGVTVDGAGFIGAQDDVVRDIKYGLVVTTGVAHVRCEQSVNVGDYVISNDYGYAQKNKNGYKVAGRHQINGVEYAEITLVTPIGRMCELTNDVENLEQRMGNAETNIVAAINVANAAYNKAEESGNISAEAIKNALDALDKSNETQDVVSQIGIDTAKAKEVAEQAKNISQSAAVAAETIRKEAVNTANSALSNVHKTQGNLDELIRDINPLTQWEGESGKGIAGFVAQSNADRVVIANLSKWTDDEEGVQSLSGIISTVGKHEAILTGFAGYEGEMKDTIAQVEQKADDNNASITSIVASVDRYSVGEYSQAYGLTREQAASILKPGYIYIPTKHKDAESHSEIFVGETEEQWFTPGNYYVWDINDQGEADWLEHSVGSVWISNAIPANSGDLQYWYIDSIDAPDGYEPYALYKYEEGQWKKVNVLAGNASSRAVSMIRQTTNEIAAEVSNARGSIAALNLTVDENKKTQAALIAKVVNDDGTVNTASIINAVTNGKSSTAITADHIVLNGYVSNEDGSFQIDDNGYMIASGGTIGGWNITSTHIDSIVDNSNKRLFLASAASNDERWICAYDANGISTFSVGKDGYLKATEADIQGNITATGGSIGQWTMDASVNLVTKLYSRPSGRPGTGLSAGTMDDSPAFWAGYTGNGNIPWNDSSWGTKTAFYVTTGGYLFSKNADIEGKIKATSGTIASWTIKNDLIYGETGDCRFQLSSGSGSSDWMWAKNGDSYPFYVTKEGVLHATGAVIKGTLQTGSMLGSGFKIQNGNKQTAGLQIGTFNTGGSAVSFEKEYLSAQYQGDSIEDARWYAVVFAANEWDNGSDKRLKNSIADFNESYEVFFNSLHPVTFKYNQGKSGRTHSGFIAQEVVSALEEANLSTMDFAAPCLLNYGTEHEGYWWLRRDQFVALNTWQIQKAKARITELEEKVEKLEQLIKGE